MEFFTGYHRAEPILANQEQDGFNWAHWILVLLGPTAVLFWVAIHWYYTRRPTQALPLTVNLPLEDAEVDEDELTPCDELPVYTDDTKID